MSSLRQLVLTKEKILNFFLTILKTNDIMT